jgi:hypothetical protein
LGDGSPVHVVAGREGSYRNVFVLVVGPDSREQFGSGLASVLDKYGLGRPLGGLCLGSWDGRADQRALQVGGGSAGYLSQAFDLDSAALRAGEVAAKVAGAQVVGSGQPPEVGLDALAGDRARSDR